ncbi:GNAT family N-acetyltransferase [uncultured Ruegeria sp.]|uniref:GNAT family N-acetyltransferase n=1 Tax=uncultured Ruegeria sp. TaxID=259304 RepID=UPI0026262B71|nr:GNAT family N-acetyltransferase [uncultured Ruegeria sp.]
MIYALARREGVLVGVGLISLEPHPYLPGAWSRAHCLSGPVCDDATEMVAFLNGLCRQPELSRVGSLTVTPFWTEEEADTLDTALAHAGWRVAEESQFRETGWVDISVTSEEIMAAFSKSARREVRRAERQGVTFQSAQNPEEFRIFLESMNRLRVSRRLPELSLPAYEAMFEDILQQDEIGTAILAWQQETFLAGLLVYRSRDIVHGRHFTTEPDHLRAAGNLRIAPALWLEAMRWAKERGCGILDVEGYREPAPGEKKFNIHKYKSEFNPQVVRRISARERIVNRHVYLTGNIRSLIRGQLKKVKQAVTG